MALDSVDWGTCISWAARVTCSVRATAGEVREAWGEQSRKMGAVFCVTER